MLRNIEFLDASRGYVVGDQGLVLFTADGGNTWSDHSINTSDTLESITFVDDMHGWVCGQNGAVYHTSDGGDSWIKQDAMTEEWLQDIHFTDLNNGWICGSNRTLFYTTDGGHSWNLQTVTMESLFGLHFADGANGWVVGNSGNILHTNNGGAVGINPEELKSNKTSCELKVYPNPFHQKLNIEVTGAKAGSVEVIIFNTQGKRIVNLDLDVDASGKINFEWHANQLPGGIYYIMAHTLQGISGVKIIKSGD
jgi:hypothetical protein